MPTPPAVFYIFDPQEVQTSGYVNEINNCKLDEQDGGKWNCKHNNEIQVHKNELQDTDSQPPMNRHKLNNAKDAVRNNKNTVLPEDRLGKSTFNINGIHPYSGVNLHPNPSISQSNNDVGNNDVGTHICSDQPSNSSAKGLSQPKKCDNKFTEDHHGLPSETTESVKYRESPSARQHLSSAQCVLCEIQGSDIYLLASSDSQIASQAGSQGDGGSEHLPHHHTHAHQSTEHTTLSKQRDLPSCKSRSCNSSSSSECFTDDLPPSRPKAEATQEMKYAYHEEFNGELEEDADIAEALAALEAATAGEDLEEEEEEY
ncbi:hypothetical protein lerEdw1_005440 [Lerista edwardsae]|nr:hypothetical protein lerEdw1_005440 [Lerista edwardsae]